MLVLTKVQTQQDPPKTSRLCDQDYDRIWSNLQQLRSKTDQIVRKIIAHTKKDPSPQEQFKLDGKEPEYIREGWSNLPDQKHTCQGLQGR